MSIPQCGPGSGGLGGGIPIAPYLHPPTPILASEHTLTNRNDKFVREDDVDVHEVVAETLRARGFGVEEDMDTSA